MSSNESFGDELLYAFVDDELDSATKESILKTMDHDESLRQRVYRIRRTKDLMRIGFEDAAPMRRDQPLNADAWWQRSRALAASLAAAALLLGAGLLGYEIAPQGMSPAQLSSQTQNTKQIVLHIGDSDPKHFATTLAYAERFLQQHRREGVQVEVVANAGGLDLLRKDVSPYQRRVLELMAVYDNIDFIACANSIHNLRRQGITPDLIPDVKMGTTAVDHIVQRVLQGWTYIKMDRLPEV